MRAKIAWRCLATGKFIHGVLGQLTLTKRQKIIFIKTDSHITTLTDNDILIWITDYSDVTYYVGN